MNVREVRYEADGRRLGGTLAIPDRPGPLPAVLIGHEGPGLDDIQRERASHIAALGYVGFALDYHGELSPFPSRDRMVARLDELSANPMRIRALGHAALDVILAEPSVDPHRVAAIGYCYGATVALELGRSGADLRAIVGFHPGLRTIRPADAANITGRVLMLIGADDPIIPIEHRIEFEQEMRKGGRRLADASLWRRCAQLHSPPRVRGRPTRHRLRQGRRDPRLVRHDRAAGRGLRVGVHTEVHAPR